jgi:hypothetical protein
MSAVAAVVTPVGGTIAPGAAAEDHRRSDVDEAMPRLHPRAGNPVPGLVAPVVIASLPSAAVAWWFGRDLELLARRFAGDNDLLGDRLHDVVDRRWMGTASQASKPDDRSGDHEPAATTQ